MKETVLEHIKNNRQDYYIDDQKLKHGEYKRYYENSSIQIHCYYKDSKLHGIYKHFHNNGQLWCICNMINGKTHGEQNYFDDTGNYQYSKVYNHGVEQNN